MTYKNAMMTLFFGLLVICTSVATIVYHYTNNGNITLQATCLVIVFFVILVRILKAVEDIAYGKQTD